MKKLTAFLLASLLAVMCLVPVFATPIRSVTADSVLKLVPLEESADKVVYARIINAKGRTITEITSEDDIKLISVNDKKASKALKDAYKELDENDVLDVCPKIAERYKYSAGTHYFVYDLVVIALFDIQLSEQYAAILAKEGNQLVFAVSRLVNTAVRIVGISRDEDKWNPVTEEVNARKRLIITNPTDGIFALVVSEGNTEGEDNLWTKLVDLWGKLFG